jgi:diaminopimelate decarboxylase
MPAHKLFGVHYHMASSAIGVGRWWDAFETLLQLASGLESVTGKAVSILDLGGGWHPNDFGKIPFPRVRETAASVLPNLRELVFEPGKALTQQSMVLASRVLDARTYAGGQREIVVDACIAEMPLASYYPHRALYRDPTGAFKYLPRGNDYILGRICMEDDVLVRHVQLPKSIQKGDLILIDDAGGYNRSMSYEFGFGGYRPS